MAQRLAAIRRAPRRTRRRQLAPFADPRRGGAHLRRDRRARSPREGRDVTAAHRSGRRVASCDGATYLLPTLVLCDSPDHPLANREFLFPFASVVPVKAEEIPRVSGRRLAVTAITKDQAALDRMLASPLLDRVNLGPLPTYQVSWDQPHEGNLFDHLYLRRALQGRVGAA